MSRPSSSVSVIFAFEDGGGITKGSRIYTDGSKTEKDLDLVRTRHSPQVVGKTTRTQYRTPGGTVGPETGNRPCSQPITILAENEASVQAAANPISRNATAGEPHDE
ncbi:hypothetical protein AVEN_93521-1 [Araneus ventricosus]|uniref:Uncharacterized protein n=1 Tax=Araneus ventricosus TaxID=182803 RepID=A0A4Y2ARE8_ARAVE|nr:hypothetical protein AVEN_93521-1 [Araneus ventricosus]